MSAVTNAVILAAGKSSKFFPPLYDKPKGLFEYEGPCLIDWEYAGMDDTMEDLATMPVRDGLTRAKYDEIVALYFGGEPTFEQKRHAYGVAALSGWYWLSWALFKDTLGEDGYFMLNAWTALTDYTELALRMYEGGDAE